MNLDWENLVHEVGVVRAPCAVTEALNAVIRQEGIGSYVWQGRFRDIRLFEMLCFVCNIQIFLLQISRLHFLPISGLTLTEDL